MQMPLFARLNRAYYPKPQNPKEGARIEFESGLNRRPIEEEKTPADLSMYISHLQSADDLPEVSTKKCNHSAVRDGDD